MVKKQTIVGPQMKHLISPALGADRLIRTCTHAYAVVVLSQERERYQAGSLRERPSICAKDQELIRDILRPMRASDAQPELPAETGQRLADQWF